MCAIFIIFISLSFFSYQTLCFGPEFPFWFKKLLPTPIRSLSAPIIYVEFLKWPDGLFSLILIFWPPSSSLGLGALQVKFFFLSRKSLEWEIDNCHKWWTWAWLKVWHLKRKQALVNDKQNKAMLLTDSFYYM